MNQSTAIEKLEAMFFNEAQPTINSNSWVIEDRAFRRLIKAAKELEKIQIVNAHGLKYYDPTEDIISGEQYYNEMYK